MTTYTLKGVIKHYLKVPNSKINLTNEYCEIIFPLNKLYYYIFRIYKPKLFKFLFFKICYVKVMLFTNDLYLKLKLKNLNVVTEILKFSFWGIKQFKIIKKIVKKINNIKKIINQ